MAHITQYTHTHDILLTSTLTCTYIFHVHLFHVTSHKWHLPNCYYIGNGTQTSPPTPGTQSIRITEQQHSILLEQLTKHSTKWRAIGLPLGFLPTELDNIRDRPLLLSNAPTSWLSAMLSEWLQWAPGDSRGSTSFATLEGLKDALREAGLGAAAHDLNTQ